MNKKRFAIILLAFLATPLLAQEEEKEGKKHTRHHHHHDKVKEIKEVEIFGRKEDNYKNTNIFSGTKTETAIKDIPQSINYVTKELILDQGANTMNDAVKNISGITQYSFYNDFSIRGFRVQGNRNSGNLVNGMRSSTSFWKQQLISNIERVEVLKGPASALFGNASPGGSINRVTKKPLKERQNSISAHLGSFGAMGIQGDFTGPLDRNKSLLYRLNLGHQVTDGFRDLQNEKNTIVAPSFSFLVSDKTQINLDLVYQNSDGKLDRGQSFSINEGIHSTSIKKSLSATNDYLKEKSINATLSFTHKFSNDLSFNSIYMRSTYDEDLLEHRRANDYVKLADGSYDYNRVIMQAFIRKRNFRNNSFSNYLNYKVDFGSVKNTILIGYDYFQTDLLSGASQLQANAYLRKDGTAVNTFNPRNIGQYVLDKNGNPVANVPFFDLTADNTNNLKDMSKYVYTQTEYAPYRQVSHGFYLQNQMKWGNLNLLFGLRNDFFLDRTRLNSANEKKTSQHAFLPRFGLVYSITPNVNLYSTWAKGYQPQAASVVSNPKAGGPFDPEKSELYEVGAKTEWFNKRLSATLSVFHLSQRGTLYSANDATNTELMEQVGKEVSKGFEVDIMGQILPNWGLSANYSFNEAKITETKNDRERGLQKPNTPKHSGGFWTKYMIPDGYLKGLGIGMGYNFVSERLGTVSRTAFPISLPAYGVADMAIYYKINNIQIQINANNFLNKTYWVGGYDALGVFPGMPFNLKTTLSYKF